MDFNKGIKEIEIAGDKVFLKKSFLGWGVVHPIKVNGKTNWINLLAGGSWIKLIIVIVFVSILVGAIFEVSGLIGSLNECLNRSIIIWKN